MKPKIYRVIWTTASDTTYSTDFDNFDAAFNTAIEIKGDDPANVVNVFEVVHLSDLN